uniref:Uncharacterized protein n=1 Tax=viral metagenome TaxID=1070528 RepID=A0A6M3K6T5_9ZZZZ
MSTFSMAALSAVGSVMAGSAAKTQGDMNAKIYEQQAGFTDVLSKLEGERLDIGKDFDLTQLLRGKSKMASTLMASTAGSGLDYSGSPVAVMLDNLTQAGIDEEITKYNYAMEKSSNIYNREQEKIGYLSRASAERFAGKTAQIRAYSTAYSTLLKGGYEQSQRGWPSRGKGSGSSNKGAYYAGRSYSMKTSPLLSAGVL